MPDLNFYRSLPDFSLTVTCMWRIRLQATFLSNRDDVNAGYKLSNTHWLGYDIYKNLPYFLDKLLIIINVNQTTRVIKFIV